VLCGCSQAFRRDRLVRRHRRQVDHRGLADRGVETGTSLEVPPRKNVARAVYVGEAMDRRSLQAALGMPSSITSPPTRVSSPRLAHLVIRAGPPGRDQPLPSKSPRSPHVDHRPRPHHRKARELTLRYLHGKANVLGGVGERCGDADRAARCPRAGRRYRLWSASILLLRFKVIGIVSEVASSFAMTVRRSPTAMMTSLAKGAVAVLRPIDRSGRAEASQFSTA
jgi:hypothetical protein